MAPRTEQADPVTAYARAVDSGEILAGRLVRLAAARHLRDLEMGHERGLRFSVAHARRAIDFFGLLNLPTGGKFKLQPAQAFKVGSVFGWQVDGVARGQRPGTWVRRFVTAYSEEGKGNGKTPLSAGVGLYGLWMDGEPAAEVYVAASKEDQAMVCFRDVLNILSNTPRLRARFDVGLKNVADLATASFMRLMSSGGGQSGPRPSMAIIDELHEHPSAYVIDMLRAGFKFRTQPLMWVSTNSGFDRDSVCYVYRQHSEKVLTGQVEDDTWFAFVAGLDACDKHREEGKTQPIDGCKDCDDWRDEAVWEKANPCLGHIIRKDYLRREVDGAKARPTEEGRVKRLNFCIWTEGETVWLPAELWSRGNRPVNVADLAGRECYGGLDVASKIDVAAFVLCFPGYPEPGYYTLLPRFWIPQATADTRQQKDGVPWTAWERQGLVTLTPGDVIHPDAIEDGVKEAYDRYALQSVRFDPWNAAQMSIHLQEHGVGMVEFGQTLRNFNEPSKEFEKLLKEGKLIHGNHAVLNWMAGNAVVLADNSGNIRPLKPDHNSPKKVDGIVGAVMSLAGAMLADGGWYAPGSLLS